MLQRPLAAQLKRISLNFRRRDYERYHRRSVAMSEPCSLVLVPGFCGLQVGVSGGSNRAA